MYVLFVNLTMFCFSFGLPLLKGLPGCIVYKVDIFYTIYRSMASFVFVVTAPSSFDESGDV